MELRTWINSGRSTMKAEILLKISNLMEDAARNENDELMKTLYWVHQQIKQMPVRIQDKPQAMIGEIDP